MASSLRLYNEAKPTILIVDDMPSNLELLEAIFQKAGFSVYKALDASSGLDIYTNNPVDLAVLDVMMPGMNGFELCKTLKGLSAKHYCPVILLTALNDSQSRIRGLEAGADDFISKPFNTSELLTKIRSLLKLKELKYYYDACCCHGSPGPVYHGSFTTGR
jgi:DNA-binding response OmpR family regulator